MRYFFLTFVINKNGGILNFSNFTAEFKTYPTYKECIEFGELKRPEALSVILMSISELSKKDFDKFNSKQ